MSSTSIARIKLSDKSIVKNLPKDHLSPQSTNRTFRSVTNLSSPSKLNQSSEHPSGSSRNNLPYDLLWSLGADGDVGILNLSDSQRDDVCFVSGEVLVLMNLWTRQMKLLNGHVYRIECMGCDEGAQHIVTGSSREIIVWDSYLGVPILVLSSEHSQSPLTHAAISVPILVLSPEHSQSPLTHAAISSSFHYVLALNSTQLYVWNIGLLKQNIQANFVYTLPEPIEEEVVEFLVDPENESNLCAVISVNKLLLFGLEQRKHIERQELRVFIPNASERNSGEFTCGAYLTGTTKLLVGTQDGFITVWAGSALLKHADVPIDSSHRKTFVKEIRLPRAKEVDSSVSVTDLKCTVEVVIAGDSDGEITIMSPELKLLYWAKQFGVSFVKGLSIRQSKRDRLSESRLYTPSSSDQKQPSVYSVARDLRVAIGEKVEKTIGSETIGKVDKTIGRNVEKTAEKFGSETESSGISEKPLVTAKLKLETFLEEIPTEATLERNALKVDDLVVLGDKGELVVLNFTEGTYSVILEPQLSGIKHLSPHPRHSLMYVLYDHNTVGVIDYQAQEIKRVKKITTMKESPTSHQRQILCRSLNEKHALEIESNEAVTYVLCMEKFGVTLILCGFQNGMLSVLDDYFIVQSRINSASSEPSPVASILSNEANTILAVAYEAGTIGLYDMIDPTELQLITIYQAHTQVTEMIMDNPTPTQTTLVSIGTDRMCQVRHVAKLSESYSFGNVQIKRITQFSQPLFIRSYPSEYFVKDEFDACADRLAGPIDESLYLIGDSEFKYRFHLKSNLKCVKTIQTPLLRTPVVQFRLIPELNAAEFSTRTEMGVQKLPLDPLMYSYIYLTLPLSTDRVYFTSHTHHLISIGKTNDSLLLWKITTEEIQSVRRHFESKHDLEPYYWLIPGGRHGNEYAKIENVFVYFTIQGACREYVSKQACFLHSGDIAFCTTIDLCDLPFILSALGFFPSEFDLRNISAEIDLMGLTELDFAHFLVLYLNHRPVRSVSYEEVLRAVEYFAQSSGRSSIVSDTSRYSLSSSTTISTQSFNTCSTNSLSQTSFRHLLQSSTCVQSTSGHSLEHVNNKGDSPLQTVQHLGGSFLKHRSLSVDTLLELLMNSSEVQWSREQAKACVAFLFAGDERLDVNEVAARLVQPQHVIELDEDSIRVYV
ncbi:hypothetical protein M8J77_008314 [Diaphorina citri]|nr:hypothetical protein M8J77_008314 [Diaphorina citri]